MAAKEIFHGEGKNRVRYIFFRSIGTREGGIGKNNEKF